jgi:hypothetical protein
MGQVEKPDWSLVQGELVEHAHNAFQNSYCIYKLTSLRGEVLYATTRGWTLLEFRLDWRDIPLEWFSDWLFYTTLEETRFAVGNVNNEDRGIQPFEYDKSQYMDENVMHYCLCCGYKTIEGYETNFGFTIPPNTYDICEICYWQDDPVDYAHPDEPWGPNRVSLKQAQRNFLALGAVEESPRP